ncbi:MAG: DNA polymerase II large subunit [Candidatus Pacearchaeota archaeon]|nr:DNA polymerase II large subunit [Candidatus Pacearchaeota archaeon]
MSYTKETEEYFENLEKDVREVYKVAKEARSKGLDPVDKVEIPLAMTMAEKCVGIVSVIYPQVIGAGIDERILELEKEYGKLNPTVMFKIGEEIARQEFCKFESELQAIDAGIRVGFCYWTIGVVSPPIEGFTGLKLQKTRDGKDYFVAYFSGPIRAAGTTASCLVLMLIDYLRELFGYARYDASEEEVKRYVVENTDYHERVTNLQYFPLEEEIEFLASRIPIQISGEPTEKLEVSNYKNLDRVESNNIRGGMCLIFSEGLAQKAQKAYRLLEMVKKNGVKITGFDWIPQYLELHEKLTSGRGDKNGSGAVYLKDLVAGRPVFGHPGKSGNFRFRYGRSRVDGFSAVSIHPASMTITDNFIGIGTQLKVEKPTKGCVVCSCDSVEGPIVKLKNGSVLQIESVERARELYEDVEEIIYLGDVLFPLSDVVNRGSNLVRSGYVEEWWKHHIAVARGIDSECLEMDIFNVSFEDAVKFSEEYKIPFYPKYIFYWTQINRDLFRGLIEWIEYSWIEGGLVLPYGREDRDRFELGKRALELLGVCHKVIEGNVVLDKIVSKALLLNLGFNLEIFDKNKFFLKEHIDREKYFVEGDVLEIVNNVCKFEIKDKAGEFIGSRMGRPEKAKLRKIGGSPNVLFSVGNEGGRLKSVQAACEVGKVKENFPLYFCEKCGSEDVYFICRKCGGKNKKMYYFRDLNKKGFSENIEGSNRNGVLYNKREVDIKSYFDDAVKKLGLVKENIPLLVKGVRGMSSDSKVVENLGKGILRAKYDLQVNKDGTIRFDATELPLVSFKPKEIEVSVEKLKEIGYVKDIRGKDLVDENQILELKPHDVVLPCAPDSPDEKADDVFIRICGFVDELLLRFYKMKPIYNVKSREDLVGKLGVFMAPHNCAGVVCRFIGFSKVQGLLASPYMHAAVRRDCDGDEAAIMMLGDVLLNFSKEFLPSHRGGTQDAPLVLNAKINAGEVDDQLLDFEMVKEYPLELYELSEKEEHSSKVKFRNLKEVLKTEDDPFVNLGFTHDTNDFNYGVNCSSYKYLATMQEKVEHEMRLIEKLRSADTEDVARLIIEKHFIRDIRGNLRKFSMQSFRCGKCNEIVRRPPLSGVCPVCKGGLIFTVNEGGIRKYLKSAQNLAKKYNLSSYVKQNLELIQRYLDSIFGKEERQEKL